MKSVKRVIFVAAFVFLLILAVLTVLRAQQTPAAKYNPTEIQQLRLQHAQDEAKLAQKDMVNFCGGQGTMGQYQEAFQRSMMALSVAGENVRKENKWPDDVKFDPNSLAFNEPPPAPKPPAPKEEKKP